MRYSRDHKERTRQKILGAAARQFRTKGFRAAGIDEVMRTVGLTAGAFYGHFASKDALLAEALRASFDETRVRLVAGLEGLESVSWLRAVVGRYLSRTHRDDPASGCALPALAAEVGRERRRPRKALETYVRQLLAELAPRTPPAPGLPPEDRVLATIALLCGALTVARAVEDPDLSDRILRAARRLAVPEAADAAAADELMRTRRGES